MPVRKLETVDAFVLTDFADVPASGYVRRGRKILQSSTWDLTRSATYTFAAFSIERGGASAGINAVDEGAEAAIASFRAELSSDVESGALALLDGKGVRRASDAENHEQALATTVTTAAKWALGGSLDGRRLIVEGGPAVAPEPLLQRLADEGAELLTVDGVAEKPWLIWGADADAVVVGSKPGAMTHQGAEMLKAKAVIPWAPTPVTTKALAVMIKNGIVYVPDFVAASGPLLAGLSNAPSGVELSETVTSALDESAASATSADEPIFLAASRKAEAFLATWQETLPFGRPLAG